jgi:hypothetical protein
MRQTRVLMVNPLYLIEAEVGEKEFKQSLRNVFDGEKGVSIQNIDKKDSEYKVYLTLMGKSKEDVKSLITSSDLAVDYCYFEI